MPTSTDSDSGGSDDDSDDDLPITQLFNSVKLNTDHGDSSSGSSMPAPASSSPPKLMPPAIPLRDYQQKLLNDADGLFAKGSAVLAYLPTGGGKTRVGAAAIASWVLGKGGSTQRRRCLFIVNRRSLLLQTRSALLELGFSPAWIRMIGGGATDSGGVGWDDTDAPPIGIATIQSLHEKFLAAHSLAQHTLAIIDEAHAACATTYLRLIAALPPTARILGLTATPFRTAADESLASVFPACAWGPSVSRLIGQRVLVPPIVHGPKQPLHATKGGGGGASSKDGWTKAVQLDMMLQTAVSSWRRHGEGERTVAFCPSVAASKALAELFQDAGVAAVHVDAETSDAVRARAFADLREGGVRVLCNVDVLSEGFDEPRVGCVMLLRHTESRRVYVQQVGRGLRNAPGKVRCIVLDEVGAIWRHGPLTGPIRSDYSWEGVGRDGSEARQLLHRCRCGVLSHRDVGTCPACGMDRHARPPLTSRDDTSARLPTQLTDSVAAGHGTSGAVKLQPFGAPLPKPQRTAPSATPVDSTSARANAPPPFRIPRQQPPAGTSAALAGSEARPLPPAPAQAPVQASVLAQQAVPPRVYAEAGKQGAPAAAKLIQPSQFALPGGALLREPRKEGATERREAKPPPLDRPRAGVASQPGKDTEQAGVASQPMTAREHAGVASQPVSAREHGGVRKYDPREKVVFSSAALAATARAEAAARAVSITSSSSSSTTTATTTTAAATTAAPSAKAASARPAAAKPASPDPDGSIEVPSAALATSASSSEARAQKMNLQRKPDLPEDPADALLGALSSLAVAPSSNAAAARDSADVDGVDSSKAAAAGDGDRPDPPDVAGLPPSWVVAWSKKRGRWYYFDKKTAQRQWHRPEAAVEIG